MVYLPQRRWYDTPEISQKFATVSLLHDHFYHTGKLYVNGHCIVSLTPSFPVFTPCRGRTPLIRYLAIPVREYDWKTFWALNAYRIRRQNGIEHMVNLVNLVHSSLKCCCIWMNSLQSTKTPVRKNCEAIWAGKYSVKYFLALWSLRSKTQKFQRT